MRGSVGCRHRRGGGHAGIRGCLHDRWLGREANFLALSDIRRRSSGGACARCTSRGAIAAAEVSQQRRAEQHIGGDHGRVHNPLSDSPHAAAAAAGIAGILVVVVASAGGQGRLLVSIVLFLLLIAAAAAEGVQMTNSTANA
jgi:hypothetical protein